MVFSPPSVRPSPPLGALAPCSLAVHCSRSPPCACRRAPPRLDPSPLDSVRESAQPSPDAHCEHREAGQPNQDAHRVAMARAWSLTARFARSGRRQAPAVQVGRSTALRSQCLPRARPEPGYPVAKRERSLEYWAPRLLLADTSQMAEAARPRMSPPMRRPPRRRGERAARTVPCTLRACPCSGHAASPGTHRSAPQRAKCPLTGRLELVSKGPWCRIWRFRRLLGAHDGDRRFPGSGALHTAEALDHGIKRSQTHHRVVGVEIGP